MTNKTKAKENEKQKQIISRRRAHHVEHHVLEHLRNSLIDCIMQLDNQSIDSLLVMQLLDMLDEMYGENGDVSLLRCSLDEFSKMSHDRQQLLWPFRLIDRQQRRN